MHNDVTGTVILLLKWPSYKGAPTCQWKNICKHVKRRPAKDRLTTIWFNRPIFGLGLNQEKSMNLHDSIISRRPRTTAIILEFFFFFFFFSQMILCVRKTSLKIYEENILRGSRNLTLEYKLWCYKRLR